MSNNQMFTAMMHIALFCGLSYFGNKNMLVLRYVSGAYILASRCLMKRVMLAPEIEFLLCAPGTGCLTLLRDILARNNTHAHKQKNYLQIINNNNDHTNITHTVH
jgi:hypothetical protein